VESSHTHDNAREEAALRAELDAARDAIAAIESELRGVDARLEELGEERSQYDLLHAACSAIEKLDEHDAAELFWGGLVAPDAARGHLTTVRERIDLFQHRIAEIESGRHAVLARLTCQQDRFEIAEDALYELLLEEERRRHEWLIERDASLLPERAAVMPWTRGREEDARFRRSLATALLLALLLGLVFPYIPLPILDRWEAVEVPERFAKLLEEKLPEPPPVQQPAAVREELAQAKPVADEETKTPEPAATKEKAQPGAGAKGILAFRDQFSPLADSRAASRLGASARIRRDGEAAVGRSTRSLVTTLGAGSSGGIDVSTLSRNVGGGGGNGIEGVQVTQATSAIGAIGGGRDRPLSGGLSASRTDEEIQIVFDRHKAALYRLYNRELRRDPTLRGQIVLRLTIEPDGSVSMCEVKSSDMKATDLGSQVVARVNGFDFGAKEGISAITILYPIDFLPAT